MSKKNTKSGSKQITKTKKSKKSKNEEIDMDAALQEAKEIAKALKRSLKIHSKSKLIEIIITYASDFQEMQQLAKHLHEENKKLKEQINEDNPKHTGAPSPASSDNLD